MNKFTYITFCGLFLLSAVTASELTFELPDSAKQCFHEVIDTGVQCTVEFQVVTGGQYDVDMHVEAPNKEILYNVVKKQYDSFTWTTNQPGVYTVCFSNEFSTFTHKLVYLDFQVGDDPPLFPLNDERVTAMTLMESSSEAVHSSLRDMVDYQTHHRLRETQGRKRAEDLSSRVQWYSIGQSIVIVSIMCGQVLVLRSFFSEKKPLKNVST
ncbi:PREDICTED: transmembrane emp24 domain-containing protein 7-like [Priapulus caudatus]|uniref:Transmembrane emp24 domain-containing protein 7-like n=1 Tax=Priapulus caudatus TaxID=37621 RepID=A0ABM1E1J8_PRICU|nr:PREDICTED: transmembrane emp24 domain-containing protein 7-like [Priapulus caudatus]